MIDRQSEGTIAGNLGWTGECFGYPRTTGPQPHALYAGGVYNVGPM